MLPVDCDCIPTLIETLAVGTDATHILQPAAMQPPESEPLDTFVNPLRVPCFRQSMLHALAGGKPLLVADVGFAFPRPPYAHVEWNMFTSQAEAGKAYRSYVINAARTNYIIGFQKCEYIDRAVAQPVLGLKEGMLTFNGSEHQPFCDIVAAANAEAALTRAELMRNSTGLS